MPENNFRNLNDSVLVTRLNTMISTIIENPADYGLDGSEVEAMQTTKDLFNVKIETAQQVDAAKLGAYADKDATRATLLDEVSSIVKRIYSTPSVDDKLLETAGLAPRPGRPQYTIPNAVSDFSAAVKGPDSILLKWRPNGNISSTRYLIEVQVDGGSWSLLTSVTAGRFVHSGIDPGVMMSYRVYAMRGTRKGPYSTIASVWTGGEEATLQIAA